jgi:RHS repeat-associated protein
VAYKYQHTDALGSPVAVTASNRTVLERSEFEPYGKLLNRSLEDGPGYTGHVSDAATGLSYMQQRYYDPGIGRFLTVDPVTADSSSGDNFNLYWYGNDNPYKFTDPDGRFGHSFCESAPVLPVSPYTAPVISLPTRTGVVTEGFGPRIHPVTGQAQQHNGTDFRAPKGAEILSTQDGKVASVTSGGPGGNQIMVKNNDGSLSGYAHTGAAEGVKKGAEVTSGQVIGKSDGSGRATGAHLHYTYRPGSTQSPATTATKPVDPVKTQLKDKDLKKP